jgi:catechol 2,3-dioxygenase-like lactoylglutathione lyase family enzyme
VNTSDRRDNRLVARLAAAGPLKTPWTANRIIRRDIVQAVLSASPTKGDKEASLMPLNALQHITVQTDDLEATRDFYRDVLGLRVGFRPDLDFPGYWLYCGEVPVVHLVPRGNAIGGGPSSDTGPFDHFAFLASDFQGVRSTLNEKGISYRENYIASPPIDQLFFPDNNNVMVELNFPRT